MINIRRSLLLLGLLWNGGLVGCNFGIRLTTPSALPNSSPVAHARSPETMSMIAFDTLTQGNSYTAGLEKPTLFVASNADETAHLTQLLNNPEVTKQIQAIDFNSRYLVAVFGGQVGSSGHSITIQQIRNAAATVQVTVNLTDPPPNRMVSTVVTYPYHLVLVPREKLHLPTGTSWSVSTPEGKLLAQAKYP